MNFVMNYYQYEWLMCSRSGVWLLPTYNILISLPNSFYFHSLLVCIVQTSSCCSKATSRSSYWVRSNVYQMTLVLFKVTNTWYEEDSLSGHLLDWPVTIICCKYATDLNVLSILVIAILSGVKIICCQYTGTPTPYQTDLNTQCPPINWPRWPPSSLIHWH